MAAASTVPGAPAISGVLVHGRRRRRCDARSPDVDGPGGSAHRVNRSFAKRARHVIAKGLAAMHAWRGDRRGPSVRSHMRSRCRPTTIRSEPAMRVVAAEHASFPSSTRLTFDLGPDDGSPLHFDVFEQERSAAEVDAVRGRPVLRAHLVRERGYDRSMVVTFELELRRAVQDRPRDGVATGVGAVLDRSARRRSTDQSRRQATRGSAASELLESFSNPSKFAALSAGQKSSTVGAVRIDVLDLEHGLVLSDVRPRSRRTRRTCCTPR